MISSTQRQLVSKGLVLVAGAMASAACLGALPHEAGAQSAFYLASRAELAGRPGTLIRTEPMLGAPDGAAAYRSPLPFARPPRRADRRFRCCHHSGRAGAAGRPADRRLGASDDRRGAALRAVAGFVYFSAGAGAASHGRARLCRDRDRLSRARHRRVLTPTLSASAKGVPFSTPCAPRASSEVRTAAGASRCGGIRRAARPRSIPGFWRRPTRRSWTWSASRRQRRRPNLPS